MAKRRTTKPVDPVRGRKKEVEESDKLGRWLWILLILAMVFFLFSLAVAVFTIFWGDNTIRAGNVMININGEDEVQSGDVLDYELEVLNQNQVELKNVDLSVRFPEGARDPEDSQTPLTRKEFELGDIPSGGRVTEEVSMVLFGLEEEEYELQTELEFNIPGSTGRFTQEAELLVTIDSSPVSVSLISQTDIRATQKTEFQVRVSSNTDETLPAMIVQADYPSGFDFHSSTPEPARSDNQWQIGSLAPGQSTEISLTGSFDGVGGEEKTLRFHSGPAEPDSSDMIAVYNEMARTFQLRPPFVSFVWRFPGMSDGELISELGREMEGEVEVKNNLEVDLKDLEIYLDIPGRLIDLDTLSVEDRRSGREEGFYDHRAGRVVWSYVDIPELSELRAGDSISFPLEFFFKNDRNAIKRLSEPREDLLQTVSARQTDTSELSTNIYAERQGVLKLSTDLEAEAEAVYSIGPFVNSGPIPPRLDEPTYYTVVLDLSSSFTDLKDIEVEMELPGYVEWMDEVAPAGEDVRFQSASNKVIWRRELLEAGRGFEDPARELMFQIRYNPRQPHQDKEAELVRNIKVKGVDVFTGEERQVRVDNVTTLLERDPEFEEGDEIVQ